MVSGAIKRLEESLMRTDLMRREKAEKAAQRRRRPGRACPVGRRYGSASGMAVDEETGDAEHEEHVVEALIMFLENACQALTHNSKGDEAAAAAAAPMPSAKKGGRRSCLAACGHGHRHRRRRSHLWRQFYERCGRRCNPATLKLIVDRMQSHSEDRRSVQRTNPAPPHRAPPAGEAHRAATTGEQAAEAAAEEGGASLAGRLQLGSASKGGSSSSASPFKTPKAGASAKSKLFGALSSGASRARGGCEAQDGS